MTQRIRSKIARGSGELAILSLLADREPTLRTHLARLPMHRRYVSGELTRESLDGVRAAGCDVRVVPGAAHVLMTDNLDGFVATLVDR